MIYDENTLYNVASKISGTKYSLFDLAKWKNGLAFKNINFSDTGIPVIKIAELNSGIGSTTAYTNQIFSDDVHLVRGDLLFSWSGNPETSIDIFRFKMSEGWLNQHIFKVIPYENIVDRDYFYFLMKFLKPYFKKIASNKQTTGLGHVTISDLKRMIITLPPMSMQKKIVAIIKPIDDKVELNNKINDNLYYHENISYKLKPFVFNCYIQIKIYNIILNKFFYESETGFENNDPIDLNKDKELIEKFDFLIQKYHTLDKFEYYSKKSKKLFINLKKYHAIEVFTNIKNEIQKANENLLNAPILWIYFFLCKEEFIIELKELYDNSTICDFIEFNYEKISEKIEMDELYIKNHSETEEFVKKLKEIYHSIVIIDDENFTISKKDHQLLINYYNEKFKDDESIFCGDIIDFFNSAQIRNNVFQYKIESYQIRSLKEFLFNEYDSEIDE